MSAIPATLDPVFPGIGIVDCDSHYTEPPDLWTSRAPRALKDRVPHLRHMEGRDLWFVGDNVLLGAIGTSVIGKGLNKVRGKLFLPQLDLIDEASYEPRARLKVMDGLGISHQILYPNVAGFGSSRFLAIPDADLRLACVSIYNDAVAELQRTANGRLLPQGILPFWDLPATLKEMRRIREELHLTGVTIPDTPDRLGLPDFGDPHWEPFWEAAEALHLPLNFHIGSADFGMFTNSPWKSMGDERKTAIGAAMLYMDNARVIANLLYSDIIDRHPDLRFVSVESGLGWIPFILEACEYQWDEMCPTEVRTHKLRPTEKFRQSIYACFWFEEDGPRRLIDKIGAERVLFETDFPHPTCLYPGSRQHLKHVLGDLPEQTRRRVLCDNATELYRIAA
jgi:predicted TIM-barrel fold metal-dependent hydrolase